MQKLLRRTAQAEKQVTRRRDRDKKFAGFAQRQKDQSELRVAMRDCRQQRGKASAGRRAAWALGPLAPREDTAFGRHGYWGELTSGRVVGAVKPARDALEALCAWAGGLDGFCLAEQDRVVVLDGPLKGRISRVRAIKMESGGLELETEGWANTAIPEFVVGKEVEGVVQTHPGLVPINAVRLVHPLTDPATGATRDVVIRELRPGARRAFDPARRAVVFDRVVPGLNVRIPWPARAAPDRPEHPADTPRLRAEARSFVPTLLRPPLPAAVVDELRGRYSRFRTRHDPAYVARKAAEWAAPARRAAMPGMRTPLQDFHRAERERRRARGQPLLTDAMLERIGEVIARNKLQVLEAGGMTEEDTGERGGEEVGRLVDLPPPSAEETAETQRPTP